MGTPYSAIGQKTLHPKISISKMSKYYQQIIAKNTKNNYYLYMYIHPLCNHHYTHMYNCHLYHYMQHSCYMEMSRIHWCSHRPIHSRANNLYCRSTHMNLGYLCTCDCIHSELQCIHQYLNVSNVIEWERANMRLYS